MKCLKCEKEGAYIRTKTEQGKKTNKKEVYCRLCGEATEIKTNKGV